MCISSCVGRQWAMMILFWISLGILLGGAGPSMTSGSDLGSWMVICGGVGSWIVAFCML